MDTQNWSNTSQEADQPSSQSEYIVLSKPYLILLLQTRDVKITFTKSDGTERVMLATLAKDKITPYEKKTERVKKTNLDILPVWDLEANAWRAVNIKRIKELEY